MKEKFMKKFLDKSDSYNFYKEYYEKMGGNENFDANIELQKLREDFEKYKKSTDRTIKSSMTSLTPYFWIWNGKPMKS